MKKERFGKMPDKAQERIAEELRVAFFDFLSAVKQGVVSPAQRSALERALTNAKDLPDALYCAAITKARIEAAYSTRPPRWPADDARKRRLQAQIARSTGCLLGEAPGACGRGPGRRLCSGEQRHQRYWKSDGCHPDPMIARKSSTRSRIDLVTGKDRRRADGASMTPLRSLEPQFAETSDPRSRNLKGSVGRCWMAHH